MSVTRLIGSLIYHSFSVANKVERAVIQLRHFSYTKPQLAALTSFGEGGGKETPFSISSSLISITYS